MMRGAYESTPSGAMDSVMSLERRCTLDEPVTETILRDLRSIRQKLAYVMMPVARHEKGKGLRDWDLWGPLLLCLVLGMLLSFQHPDEAARAFALVFTIVWGGSGVVTINAVLLRGNIAFFQSVCVLGYCLFPLVLAEILLAMLRMFFVNRVAILVKVFMVSAAFAWASAAAVAFISDLVPADRKVLGIYPVLLFYVAIAVMILMN
mmetsp:Transcript_28732/g.66694  ORF Transcript_28732/g.66694 Transcript_28732/m.66694 type:complete len:206 (-) Transcript_28732:174-791(-)